VAVHDGKVVVRKMAGLVGGVFSENSFASSYPDPEDLYLEEVWQVSDDGAFERAIPGTRGLWVSREAFDVLEFFGVD
jgi:hypothetical protein